MLAVPGNDKPGCRSASIPKPKKSLLEPWQRDAFLGEVALGLSYHPGMCYLGNCRASSARHYSRMSV